MGMFAEVKFGPFDIFFPLRTQKLLLTLLGPGKKYR